MKIIKVLLLCSALIAAITIISCSSNNSPTTPNNTTTGNFSSLALNNYWINLNYDIDSLGHSTGIITTDSTVVTGSTTKANHAAFLLTSFDANNMPIDTQYVYEDSVKYYIHSHFFNSKVDAMLQGYPNPFNLGDTWLKIADYDLSNWDLMSDSIINFQITTGTYVNGLFSLKATKGITKNVTLGSNNLSLQEFILTFQFSGQVTIVPGERTLTLVIHNWFDKKGGLLISTFDNAKFDLGLYVFPFQGTEKKCIRYNVK